MPITSMLAIYFLFWFLSLFVVLPFGVRTNEEMGKENMPGHVESAPHEFRPWRIILRTTLVAAAFFALFYANWENGWITVRSFDGIFNPPEQYR